MRKSPKGEVVLSFNQIQAAHLNKVEYQRFQRNVKYLQNDFQEQIARIHREQQGIKYHYKNVVRVVKPNRAYQLWKQNHAYEIAKDEEKELLESLKFKQKNRSRSRRQTVSSINDSPTEPLRPLLLLVEDESKKPVTDPIISIAESFLRPQTSSPTRHIPSIPSHRANPILTMLDRHPSSQTSSPHRINPILTMLTGRPASSNVVRQPTQQYDSPSFYSVPTQDSVGSRRYIQGKFVVKHKKSDLDALYRIALQNQTAYKAVDQTLIEKRKLHDKEFASQHRALKGSMRSASVVT